MAFLDSIKNLLPGGKKVGSVSGGQVGKTINKRVVVFGSLLVVSIVIMVVLLAWQLCYLDPMQVITISLVNSRLSRNKLP